eukprot:GSChrysophyteH1.ASY1.ANO1.1934.1 assembled CDS
MASFGSSRPVSKYKNMYCDHPSADHTFTNLRVGSSTTDGNYIQANSNFFVYAAQGGGGPFVVQPVDKPGRIEADVPTVNGHTGACLNFDWNPFNDNVLATASEDTTVKIWTIPDGGFTANHHEFDKDLHGHLRKVIHVKFNPTAENALASVGAEHSVKLWDIERGECVLSNDDTHGELIHDIAWDHFGNQYATTCKDKTARICDARTGALVAHSRDLSKPLHTHDIDQAAGDGAVHYFDCTSSAPYVTPLNTFRSTNSAKGMAFMTKRGLDTRKNETARLFKLTTNAVEPLSFIVPRKSDAFQPDLYPDTRAPVPAHSFSDWMGGSNKGPKLMSLDPSSFGKVKDSAGPGAATATAATAASKAPVTVASLQKELAAARGRIAELEGKCKAAGIAI